LGNLSAANKKIEKKAAGRETRRFLRHDAN
jgi:hypothetical protein